VVGVAYDLSKYVEYMRLPVPDEAKKVLELQSVAEVVDELPRCDRGLDIGTATGRYAAFFARQGFDVVRIDVSRDALSTAKTNLRRARLEHKVSLRQMDAVRLDLPRDSFDIVTCMMGTFCHIPRAEQSSVLGRIRSVLRPGVGFDAETCGVMVSIDPQSPDIARGVDRALEARENDEILDEIGAGDQGMMFGFACEETEELMPFPITLAHALTRRLSEVRNSGELDYLRPDGKSQVTVRYEGDRPVGVEKVLVSAQHRGGMEKRIRDDLVEAVIRPVMPGEFFDENTAEILVNPTGRFVV
jgi:SAM-dependent methyltransferase